MEMYHSQLCARWHWTAGTLCTCANVYSLLLSDCYLFFFGGADEAPISGMMSHHLKKFTTFAMVLLKGNKVMASTGLPKHVTLLESASYRILE
jgi:hypothetical protein